MIKIKGNYVLEKKEVLKYFYFEKEAQNDTDHSQEPVAKSPSIDLFVLVPFLAFFLYCMFGGNPFGGCPDIANSVQF